MTTLTLSEIKRAAMLTALYIVEVPRTTDSGEKWMDVRVQTKRVNVEDAIGLWHAGWIVTKGEYGWVSFGVNIDFRTTGYALTFKAPNHMERLALADQERKAVFDRERRARYTRSK